MSRVSEKKYPSDVEEIYYATKSELEVKLAEAEAFITATNAKSFEVVVNAVNETTILVGDFVKQKSKALESTLGRGKATTSRLRNCQQEISSLQAKLATMDKAKELSAFKKECVDDLDREV